MLNNLFLLFFLIQIGQNNSDTFYYGSRQDKKIALTFDACPSSTNGGYDPKIVQTLLDSNVASTFFLSGKWIVKHKQAAKYIASLSNIELCNHSYSHPHCKVISDDSIRQELLKAEQLLYSFSGVSHRFFRPPFGEADNRVEQIAKNLGFKTIMFDIASGDPDTTISKERLVQYVASQTRNGSIILMHVNGRGWQTAKALPEIIHLLRKNGFIFVKVSELIEAQKHRNSEQTVND